ncbi:MAG: hydrogenase [Thermoplasmata archaeon]|nr:hydrogenase [Thermoplasmata archaeon]
MLETGFGYWDAIAWIVAFIVICIVVYIIRSMGKKEHRKEAEEPFFSGVELPDEKVHVKASNIYWGFIESMKGYYDVMKKMHDGIINNYISWFVFIAVLLLITLFAKEVIP